MTDSDPSMGHQLLNLGGNFVNGLYPVVHEVDLPATLQFKFQSRTNQLLVKSGHHRLNGHAIFGRRLDDAHIAQAHKGHMQGARNGRGRHRQHIDFAAHLLQALFVAHPEALLLIHHQQAEIMELQIL